jgi:hypothetical protein
MADFKAILQLSHGLTRTIAGYDRETRVAAVAVMLGEIEGVVAFLSERDRERTKIADRCHAIADRIEAIDRTPTDTGYLPK